MGQDSEMYLKKVHVLIDRVARIKKLGFFSIVAKNFVFLQTKNMKPKSRLKDVAMSSV